MQRSFREFALEARTLRKMQQSRSCSDNTPSAPSASVVEKADLRRVLAESQLEADMEEAKKRSLKDQPCLSPLDQLLLQRKRDSEERSKKMAMLREQAARKTAKERRRHLCLVLSLALGIVASAGSLVLMVCMSDVIVEHWGVREDTGNATSASNFDLMGVQATVMPTQSEAFRMVAMILRDQPLSSMQLSKVIASITGRTIFVSLVEKVEDIVNNCTGHHNNSSNANATDSGESSSGDQEYKQQTHDKQNAFPLKDFVFLALVSVAAAFFKGLI